MIRSVKLIWLVLMAMMVAPAWGALDESQLRLAESDEEAKPEGLAQGPREFGHNPKPQGPAFARVAILTEPYQAITLAAPVAGRVKARPVEEGQQVSEGDLLLVLDNDVEILEAKRRLTIWQDKSSLRAAEFKAALKASMHEGNQQLFDRNGSVSLEELQQSELDARVAAEELARIRVAEEIEEYEYKLAVAQRDRRELRAPIDGVVTGIHSRVGEGFELNQPLVELVAADQGMVVASVSETIGRRMTRNQAVTLLLQAGEASLTVPGVAFFVSPVVDPASGLMEVKIRFDNSDGRIRLGVGGTMLIP